MFMLTVYIIVESRLNLKVETLKSLSLENLIRKHEVLRLRNMRPSLDPHNMFPYLFSYLRLYSVCLLTLNLVQK